MKFFLIGVILFSLCQLSYAQTGTLNAGTIGVAQQICYNTAPAKLYQVTIPTGGTGSYTYRWQKSTNNTTWSNISSATQSSYSSPALTTNTWFRLRVTSGSYGTVSTNTILITVNANLTSGSIGTAQSICYNATPSPLAQLTSPGGGTGTFSFQWQSSANNSSWTNITGATSSGYSPPILTSNTYYRRSVTSGSCGTVNSASILITVKSQLSPGTIGSAQSICYNTAPSALTQLTAATGGSGTYTYQWQSSNNNSTWANITGATSANYTPTALTSNTYYRRNVTSGTCGTVSSSSILITVNSQLTAGTIGTAQTICFNSSPAGLTQLTAPSGGTGVYSYQWQSSSDYSTWTAISGATSASYSPPALIANIYYRRNVTSGNCGTASSSSVLITVNSLLTSGTIGTAQTICYNTRPLALTQLSQPTGGTGSYTYQWQSSSDNSSWTDIASATSPDSSPPVLTSNMYYRRNVTSGSCGTANSSSVLITVYAQLTAGTIGSAQSIPYNTAPASLTQLTAQTGGTGSFVFQWQNSTDNATWIDISGAAASGYSPPVLTSNMYYRRNVTSGNCGPVSSASVLITVNNQLSPGTIGTAQTICYNTAPSSLTQLTPPSGGSGSYTYQWQSSADNSSWSNIAGTTDVNYSPPILTSSTYYRLSVSSGNSGTVYTASILILFLPAISQVQLHDDTAIDSYTSTFVNISMTGGISPYAINYSRNGVAQSPISNYTSGTPISTGILTTGTYLYSLTSVTDLNGCNAQNLGSGITVITTPYSGSSYLPVDSLYRAETPSSSNNDRSYELGTEFFTLSVGFITKARLYSHINEGGNHTIRLWRLDGSSYTLIAGPFNWSFPSGILGWREFPFTSPIAVEANKTYIISISNGPDFNYKRTLNYQASTVGSYVKYNRGVYSTVLGIVPTSSYASTCYFRDIVFAINVGNLTPGIIGTNQSICFNSAPAALTQQTTPTGGIGNYIFQWQSSADTINWANISGANLSAYAPPALSSNTYYRRMVTSGSYGPVYSSPVLIKVFISAQLHDNITIFNNTATEFNVTLSGGTPPYSINIMQNGSAQPAIYNYVAATGVSTGNLSTGTYTYTLTSVMDANGCAVHNLGTPIDITVRSPQAVLLNKALVIVNSSSASYVDYTKYIKPYLDNFGIPYEECDIFTTVLPVLNDYALIVFGHKNVYSSGYPLTELEAAVSEGAGLYSFDPHLFDYTSGFNELITPRTVNWYYIDMLNTSHYITQKHSPDSFNPTNSVELLALWAVTQNSNLVGGTDLATMSTGGNNTVSILQVSNYGHGRVLKWSGYDWIFDNVLGPVYGMDDLIWRGLVWAARKPFIMQGLPPMVTMRVDDVNSNGGGIANNFDWLKISNDYGFIPWCGTFNSEIPLDNIPMLKNLIDSDKATASPHSFKSDNFIYFNHMNLASFDAAANVRTARDFYINNGLKISNYLVPHFYELSSASLSEIKAMGVEFLGIHMLPDQLYFADPNPAWINCAPFRINRNGIATDSKPDYYAGNITLNGIQFFNCITEIRDDGGYEWSPDNNITTTSARGIRHLRRALNSMVLPTLFTHEYFFTNISADNWRTILSQVTSAITGYNPEYTSMDYAVKYIRAKSNIRITNVLENSSSLEISYTGSNDMDTKCYLFTEQFGQVNYRFIPLPQINGNGQVSVIK